MHLQKNKFNMPTLAECLYNAIYALTNTVIHLLEG